MELPEINKRIKKLVEKYADDNSSKFCRMVDIKPSYKLTRLFSIENRNGKYPEPSLDIIRQIVSKLDIDINYLVFGESKFTENVVNEERKKYLTSDDKLNIIINQNVEILDKLNNK
ncbi:hypothetical protein [Pontimicrobium sp. SW4]|uniref:HTH cro/C1-type domain-containing protein n=1 Tax=Pontimicrobium sp. SW4 TaxID=3153519 RepID=A0AAU7BP65_9FLAO